MTKTEYREYIASEWWQHRRKLHLQRYPRCNRCDLPRDLAVVAYDQDLHVHHRNYARLGSEHNDDLEALCRRCHELETSGSSSLHQPQKRTCASCKRTHFNRLATFCVICEAVLHQRIPFNAILNGAEIGDNSGPIWRWLIGGMVVTRSVAAEEISGLAKQWAALGSPETWRPM